MKISSEIEDPERERERERERDPADHRCSFRSLDPKATARKQTQQEQLQTKLQVYHKN
jgi:hypothetical protein